ncbi:hypothetical protein [Clostridium sporogenes]|uniref:hypothetical protein n=1 Tax=Clostridium sporogenes TaxID=1509 RepID=UPI00024BA6FE|nr:hypothetical protein [Clostridium sporogenes]EHN15724.1 hypothetical protein IYC_08230 [Clostridium sporogenes PA 3679]MCW6107169.1 hypothetical protein [Clostridium sporogenes]MDU4596733.1 hypothetical protein [Clostridium sporogenes]
MVQFQVGSYKLNFYILYFAERDHGEAHCNLGNFKFYYDNMINWIELMKVKE